MRELQQDVADLRTSNTDLQQKNMELLQQMEDKDNKYFGMQQDLNECMRRVLEAQDTCETQKIALNAKTEKI